MDAAKSRQILDAFYTELQAIAQDGNPDTMLRWTGEQLALASDRLAKAPASGRENRAAELLVIANPHVNALATTGDTLEALATQAMAMLSVLRAKVSPEAFPSLWLQNLQMLCNLVGQCLYENRYPQVDAVAAHIFGLYIATARDYIPRFGADDATRRFYDHLRHISAKAGEDITHFQGHRIAPTLAIDILTDTLVRLQH